MKERMPLRWRERIIPTMQEVHSQPSSPTPVWPCARSSPASQRRCQSSPMEGAQARGVLLVQTGLRLMQRGHPLNIVVWMTWGFSKPHQISVQKLKGCTKERSLHSCFFSCAFLCFHYIPVRDRILERLFFCWGKVALLLQLCFDIDDSEQVSDSDLCRSRFLLSTLCLSWLIWL